MNKATTMLLILLVAPAFAGETHEEVRFTADEFRAMKLSNINGDTLVEAIEGNELVIAYTMHGSDSKISKTEVSITPRDDVLVIDVDTESSGWFGGKDPAKVNFHISAPAGMELAEIESVNGDVDILRMRGPVAASTVNGRVAVRDAEGDIRLETVNGRIELDLAAVTASQTVRAETVNGGIVLRVPKEANCRVAAETLNGRISGPSLDVEKSFVGRSAKGQMGAGEGDIRLETVNGSIALEYSEDSNSLTEL